jgi:REP element-mobilizing transposase RayT
MIHYLAYPKKCTMSESYKISEDGIYFITFTLVGWLDVFTRRIYQDDLCESIIFCQEQKGLRVFGYCIMPSHVHMLVYSENQNLSGILQSLKSYSAKKIMSAIRDSSQESRRELFLHQFRYFGSKKKNSQLQFWKHDNHAFYLYSNEMIQQKLDYIHFNPVEAGFVNKPEEWRLSSANPDSPIKTEEL